MMQTSTLVLLVQFGNIHFPFAFSSISTSQRTSSGRDGNGSRCRAIQSANARSAKGLGLTVPPMLLTSADEVVE